MSIDNWAEQAAIKARKLWPKYKNLKPIEKHRDGGQLYVTFEDWWEDSDHEHKVKTTRFTIEDGEPTFVYSRITKAQKFLAIGGPKAGQRIVNDDPGYMLYNAASCQWPQREDRSKQKYPRCVLVYRENLK